MEAGTYVTTREFDNHMASIAETQQEFWRNLNKQQESNARASENIAVLTERLDNAIAAAAERDAVTDKRLADRDKRAWALTLTVAGVVLTALIPYIAKFFTYVFGVVGA